MPSVSASCLMASMISRSEISSAQPPLSRLKAGEVALYPVGNGRAAGGLSPEEFYRLGFDPSQRYEFFEGFSDFADQRTAGHRADNVVGQAPAELLGDLETMSF